MLDTYVELLFREGRTEEAVPYTHRVQAALPRGTLKAMLVESKNHVFLGDADAACALYDQAFDQGKWVHACQLLNNVAICALRQFYAQPHRQQEFLERAEASMEKAVQAAKTPSQKEVVQVNHGKLAAWKRDGGTYTGNLMW